MIYLIKKNDFYKVGYTKNLIKKMENLSINSQIIGWTWGDNEDNKRCRKALSEYHVGSGWFDLPEELVEILLLEFSNSIHDEYRNEEIRKQLRKEFAKYREGYRCVFLPEEDVLRILEPYEGGLGRYFEFNKYKNGILIDLGDNWNIL